MRGFLAVYNKELYVFLASPIFYIVALVFLLLGGYFYYSAIAYYNVISFQASQNPLMAQELNMLSMVLRPVFFDLSIVFLLLSPLLTMKLFSEEKKTGTIELLLTLPVSDRAVVMGKFLSVLTVFTILLIGTVPHMSFLLYISKLSWKVIACCYVGMFLMGSAFLSLGLFTSSITQNQIISATLSFGGLLAFWIISWMKSLSHSTLGKVFEYISITYHFDPFTKGLIDTRHILYYIGFIVFFIFLTLRQTEVHRWRG